MPRINLLPVRAAQRIDTARNELIGALLAVVVAVLVAAYLYSSVAAEIASVEQSITEAQHDIGKLDQTVSQVKEFKAKSETLQKKLDVIDQLKLQKTGPTRLLDDLATILTRQPKVWLTKIQTRKDGRLLLEGGAMGHEHVSQFQLSLEQESHYFNDVKLLFVEGKRDKDTKYTVWSLTCNANYTAG